MNSTEVLEGFAALHAATVDQLDQLDRDGVAALVSLSARLRGWHDSVDVRLARRTNELRQAGRSEGPESMFGRQGNRSGRESEAVAKRAEVAAALPDFGNGLENGDVSSGHLDAMGNVRSNLDDETRARFDEHQAELLAAAVDESVDAFARRCRELARRLTPAKNDADELDKQTARSNVKRWVDKITGMHLTRLEIDPVRDAAIWSAVNAALAALKQVDGNARTPWQQMQVNAFVAAVQGGVLFDPDDLDTSGDGAHPASAAAGDPARRGGFPMPPAQPPGSDSPGATEYLRRTGRRVPEISVLIDLQALLGELTDHGICETEDGVPLPVSTVRRLCCDAEIIPVVLGTDGELVDLGRSSRTVNRAQRRALRAMHRTCAHPDCTVPFSVCKIHHVRWWKRDEGPSDIDNLLPVCERHHHQVHEGRWNVSMTPDRIATWTRPDGTMHHRGSTIDRHPPPASSPPSSGRGSTGSGGSADEPSVADNRPADTPMTT